MREVRHQRIVQQVLDQPLSVAALADLLDVSPATIRRDLDELQQAGLVRRVHGGAMATSDDERDEDNAADDPFAQVAGINAAAKDVIARRAASLVADHQTVILDIGTTCERVAHHLKGRPVTVVTSSLPVVDALLGDPLVQVVVTGGSLRAEYRSLVGFMAEESLRQISADIAFIGASGVRADGTVIDTTSAEVTVKRAALASARRGMLLVDHDKFPGRTGVRVCSPAELSDLITDRVPPDPTLQAMLQAEVNVLVV